MLSEINLLEFTQTGAYSAYELAESLLKLRYCLVDERRIDFYFRTVM